jgi:Ca2+:H+ antiporter
MLASVKWLFLSSWVNVLLIAVPLSFVSHFAGWGSTADFIISFIAIIPLAGVLGGATEQVAIKLGQTMGGCVFRGPSALSCSFLTAS